MFENFTTRETTFVWIDERMGIMKSYFPCNQYSIWFQCSFVELNDQNIYTLQGCYGGYYDVFSVIFVLLL